MHRKPISIVIITYNRPKELRDLILNISNLDYVNDILESVIILNNASTEKYDEIEKIITEIKHINFVYEKSHINLGVSKGRNKAMHMTNAPYLVMLDDDCELEFKNSLKTVYDTFTNPSNRDLAIISFKVLYFQSHQYQINAFPHKDFKMKKNLHVFNTYYYAGGAHAIRSCVMKQAGGYPEDFFYGMEEYDLSFKVLNLGFKIIYTDNIVMLHKESEYGRQPSKDKYKMLWINKSKVAWKYLPKIYFTTTAILWSIYYFKKCKYDIESLLKGWYEIFQIPNQVKRQEISKETVRYLKKCDARLWY